MDVRVGLWRELSAEELMVLNCGVGEDSWESLGLQGDPTSPFWRRSALGYLWRNDAKAETPVFWLPHAKSWHIGKDSDAVRDWGQEEKETTEDKMAGWHHRHDEREFVWTLGVGDGQGGLVRCDSWGCKEKDRTEWLNCTELNWPKRWSLNTSSFERLWASVHETHKSATIEKQLLIDSETDSPTLGSSTEAAHCEMLRLKMKKPCLSKRICLSGKHLI